MKINFKPTLLILILCMVSQVSYADGILTFWTSKDVQGNNDQVFNAAKTLTVAEISKKNLEVTSWLDAYLLMVGATQHGDDKVLLRALVIQITNRAKTELRSTSRLVIWERITSGEIQFEGKGLQVSDDLFTVAGRANWILRNLTKKNFGYVRPNTSDDELVKLQQKWTRSLGGEKVDEYKSPYPTPQEGLEEIRSIEALEALIMSLSPSIEKENVANSCRKRLFDPVNPSVGWNEPVALCNPDSYAHRYLSILTGIKDRNDFAWWKKWWDTNKTLLLWDKDNGSFDVKK